MNNFQSGGHGRGGSGGRSSSKDAPSLDFQDVSFNNLSPNLFSDIAEKIANTLSGANKKNEKTQVRRFYDEICRFSDRLNNLDDRQFQQKLPYIRMIIARAAYAKSRDLVDQNFVNFMRHCLNQVDSLKKLQIFRTFFEAVIGFYPSRRSV